MTKGHTIRLAAALLAFAMLCGCTPTGGEQDNQQQASGNTDKEKVSLYIGTEDNFKTYEVEISGEVTPDALIAAMGELTGWDLSLADTVTTGKGGMTVCFASASALFTGPPEPQKEEFQVYDAEDFSFMILDSIQKTLRAYFDPEHVDAMDIYYCMDGDRPLETCKLERCLASGSAIHPCVL